MSMKFCLSYNILNVILSPLNFIDFIVIKDVAMKLCVSTKSAM